MGEAAARGELGGLSAATAADLYLRLLIGDWQIRRVIGTLPEPGAAEIAARAEEAVTALRRLAPA